MKYPKRNQYKYAKSRYRIRNWPEYEAGLRNRDDLTVWLSDAALSAWRAPASGRPGGQRTYSDLAIEAALTVRMVFHLPLRQTEGFLRSLAELLDLDLPIPDHPTLFRRLQKLGNLRFGRLGADEPIHLLIPPGRGARPSSSRAPGQWERNRNIRSVRKLGRRKWCASSGYSRRSLVENAVFRYKATLGQAMRSRSLGGQRVEVNLARKTLNTMTSLGMPDSVKVE